MRATCKHRSFELNGITLNRDDHHTCYFFECAKCGKRIVLPLKKPGVLECKFSVRENEESE